MADVELSTAEEDFLCFCADTYGQKPFSGPEAIAKIMAWEKEHPNIRYCDWRQIQAL